MKTKSKKKSALRKLTRALKWLIPMAIIVALIAVAFKPRPIEVDLGKIQQNAMNLTINDEGETRVRERYTISSPISGRLLRIQLEPADLVKKGDVLAVIAPQIPHLLDPRARTQALALVHAASAAVVSAETQLNAHQVEKNQLEKSYKRTEKLHSKGNVSDATFEKIEASYLAAKHSRDASDAAVSIARFELEQAQAALKRFDPADAENDSQPNNNLTIRSPIDGQILRMYEKSGRSLQPGTKLLDIGNPNELEMRIDVLSQDAVIIKPGQRIIIRHWGGRNPIYGRVRLVEPSAYTKVSALGVDEQRVNVIADFEKLPVSSDSLGDGYRIEAGIIIWEGDDVLQVPAGALFREGKDWAVYKVEDDRARLTIIQIGRNNGEVAEVLTGVKLGDCVILHPGDRIENGTLIKPRL